MRALRIIHENLEIMLFFEPQHEWLTGFLRGVWSTLLRTGWHVFIWRGVRVSPWGAAVLRFNPTSALGHEALLLCAAGA